MAWRGRGVRKASGGSTLARGRAAGREVSPVRRRPLDLVPRGRRDRLLPPVLEVGSTAASSTRSSSAQPPWPGPGPGPRRRRERGPLDTRRARYDDDRRRRDDDRAPPRPARRRPTPLPRRHPHKKQEAVVPRRHLRLRLSGARDTAQPSSSRAVRRAVRSPTTPSSSSLTARTPSASRQRHLGRLRHGLVEAGVEQRGPLVGVVERVEQALDRREALGQRLVQLGVGARPLGVLVLVGTGRGRGRPRRLDVGHGSWLRPATPSGRRGPGCGPPGRNDTA